VICSNPPFAEEYHDIIPRPVAWRLEEKVSLGEVAASFLSQPSRAPSTAESRNVANGLELSDDLLLCTING